MTTEPICHKCGAEILKAGFIVETVRYQAFVRTCGQLMKSHSAKSGIETVRCLPCGEQLLEDPRKLLKEPVAA